MAENNESAAGFDHVGLARELLRSVRSGALATLDAAGFPFATLVTVATDSDGSPLLLLSRLSAHTTNLDRDGRVSLLLARTGRGDPLAHPRVTLVGRVLPAREARHRRRFLARHPKARLYADFPDFGFRRLAIDRAHLNGGFARAATLAAGDILTDLAGADALIDAEEAAVARLNAENVEAVRLCATRLADPPDAPWQASGLDPDGIDLLAGERTARIPFPERVVDPETLAAALGRLVGEGAEPGRAHRMEGS